LVLVLRARGARRNACGRVEREPHSRTAADAADDSKLARIVAAKAIAALQPDWQRLEVNNAEQALELTKSRDVHATVIDYNMAGKNGLEFGQELRALYPSLPIAIITANVQDEIIAATRAIGAHFVSKPLTVDGQDRAPPQLGHRDLSKMRKMTEA
jgi:CheY-like chemotaxis protein